MFAYNNRRVKPVEMKKPSLQPYLYIFLHIPKCAGSTFTYHLEQNYPKDILMPLYHSKFYNHGTGRFEHPGRLVGKQLCCSTSLLILILSTDGPPHRNKKQIRKKPPF
jgi:hypothetical protein